MKRYLVCSDIHGRVDNLKAVLNSVKDEEIDGIMIAGDMETSPGEITDLIYSVFASDRIPKVFMVRGNCDYKASGLRDVIFEDSDNGHRIMLTHGHRCNVKSGDNSYLAALASNAGADIAIYGHTHEPADEVLPGVRCINPGAVCGGYFTKAGYCILEVAEKVQVLHKSIE